MHTRLFVTLFCVLVIVRLPSLVQPMGADQGLYAYVGERILAGELPYRDAWDQKPPAIHYSYALLRAISGAPGAAAAADLAMALLVSVMLLRLGSTLAGETTGRAAALLFLFLSDPDFQRLAGVAVRAQCETFIAALITAAFLLVSRPRRARVYVLAGVLLGAAASFKYNAAAYGLAVGAAIYLSGGFSIRNLVSFAAGCVVLPLVLLANFALRGALADLYYATITYNVQYSGETYGGPIAFGWYLLTFPVAHARVDALWLLGGAGSAVLALTGMRRHERWIVPAWVGAACLTIAINGSRGLPQYFVQAAPALALAAAWAGALLWTRRTIVNLAALALAAFAVWRVNEFSNYAGSLAHDTRYLAGAMARPEHLARYGDREQRKYSALAMAELADFVRQRTAAGDPIYVFGFAAGTYVEAERASASRFFWSRPVIVDFNAPVAGYGVAGLRQDLERTPPAVVALQLRDWWPDVQNSAEFFMSTPLLSDWLRSGYHRVDGPAGFDIWVRHGAAP